MRDADIAAISPRLALLAAGSEAIATPDGNGLGLFEEGLAIPGVDRLIVRSTTGPPGGHPGIALHDLRTPVSRP
jgi:hypothetical protein